MAKDIKNQKRGLVTEALPSARFRVEVEGRIIIAYLSGKMLQGNVRVGVGDKVEVIVPPKSDRGRITWRY